MAAIFGVVAPESWMERQRKMMHEILPTCQEKPRQRIDEYDPPATWRRLWTLAAVLVFFLPFDACRSQTGPLDPGQFLSGACVSCHASDKPATSAIPGLAGRSADSITDAMTAYAAGKRPGLIMPQIARGYTHEQIQMIADYFSSQESR